MALYAACDVSGLVVAFINDDGKNLPEGFDCVQAPDKEVENGTLVIGMKFDGGAFVTVQEQPKQPTLADRVAALEAKAQPIIAEAVKV